MACNFRFVDSTENASPQMRSAMRWGAAWLLACNQRPAPPLLAMGRAATVDKTTSKTLTRSVRQAVSRAFAKQDAAHLAMADGPDYAGMLPLSGIATGSGTSSGFGAVSNYAGGSMETGWGAFSTQFTFKDQRGAQVDHLSVIGNSVGTRMTADQARAYDLDHDH